MELASGSIGWDGVASGILVPVVVVVIFEWLRELIGVESDSGTDFVLVVLSFDLTVAFGLVGGIFELLLPEFQESSRSIVIGWCIASFVLGFVSLLLDRFRDHYISTLDRDLALLDRLKASSVKFVAYVPALLAYGLHVPFFIRGGLWH